MPEKPHIALYEKNSREEESELALKRTRLTPAIAWSLTVVMMGIMYSEPLLQCALDVRHNLAANRPPWPQAFEVVDLCPGPRWAADREEQTGKPLRGFWRWLAMLPPVKAIEDFDDALERNSAIGQLLLPRVQFLMTRFGGVGNEQAYVGCDGWLFYRPDVDVLMAPGFLDPGHLKRRARHGDSSSEAVQPDPVKAIVQFHRDLQRRGITLLVMPAPSKPAIHPEQMSSRYASADGPLENPSYERFLAEMKGNGVAVFDVSHELAALKRASGRPQFLQADTHWTPEAMELAAGKLADFIQSQQLLPSRASAHYMTKEVKVSNRGDLDLMLRLSADSGMFPAQQVGIHPVFESDGKPWRSNRQSDVLVLGDSFFNIYSWDKMNWGASAGFVEHLSYRLQRPVDRIIINAGGSFTTRQELAKPTQKNRLDGKRLVIYEFAMRDLGAGDWRLFGLPAPAADTPDVSAAPSGEPGQLIVEGRVHQSTAVPKPGTVPYRDYLAGIHLKDVRTAKGTLEHQEILVFAWGMQDNRWTSIATAKPGQTLRLWLTPWEEVEDKYGGYNRGEPADEAIFSLRVFFGETSQPETNRGPSTPRVPAPGK